MANYTIIGGDKKEYGPVSAAEVRQWLAEGRLDGNSLMRQENDTEWRPLSTFLEFAPATAPPAQNPPPLTAPARPGPAGLDPEAMAAAVKGPAVGLIVVGCLYVLLALFSLVKALFFPADTAKILGQLPPIDDPQVKQMLDNMVHLMNGPAAVFGNGVALIASVVVLRGAIRMLALRSYEFAMVAAILAMVPCVTPCCLLGLPFGIWAVVALRKPGVRSHFN